MSTTTDTAQVSTAGADIVIEPLVWAKQGMKEDLSEYGLQITKK